MNPAAAQRLQHGWKSVELREVGRIVTGSTPPKSKSEYYGGSFPFVKPPELRHGPVNDAEDKLSDKGAEVADVAPVGSVLVSCIGNLGKTGRATQPVAFNQQINAIIPHEPNASKWIFYAVQTSDFASQLANVASATTISIVNKGKFSGLRIPLAPEDDQREIVAEIEKQFTRLEAGVAGLRRLQANLKRYRAAVLKAACEGKLVPTEAELAREREKVAAASRRWSSEGKRRRDASATISEENVGAELNQSRDGSATQEGPGYETGAQLLERILTERRQKWNGKGKYKEPARPGTANPAELPEGWAWSRLEQLGVTFGGLTKNPKRAKLPRKLPYLRVANVYADELRLEEIEHIGVEDSELDKLLLRPNDLLVVEGNGSKDQIGRLAIWDGSIEPCVHQNHIIKVRPVISELSKWILYWLLSPIGRGFVEIVASSTSGLYTLSVNKVGDLPVVIPPLMEQQRIVAEVEHRLSVVEELEAVVNANLQRATRLRQSILQKAFVGELVVNS